MTIKKKILKALDELEKEVKDLKKSEKKIVLCQGHFNVIHPGHLRFIDFAKRHGDYLIVALQGRERLEPEMRDKFFNEEERAHGVASLEKTDIVFIFNDISIERIIEVVQPDIYVRGEEFSKRKEEIKSEIKAVEEFGGKVMFSSGEILYATTELLERDFPDITERHHHLFRTAMKKQNITIEKLNEYCDDFKNLHILVIGDTIVDQYIACDALGMSSEAPVLVLRELNSKEYVGGAAVVSRHVSALGAKCSFISIIGSDDPGKLVKKELEKDNVEAKLIVDEDRPTTFKIRYMVDSQKILRVSRLKDHYINQKIENRLIEHIDSMVGSIHGIIVSDFVYGVITPKVLEYISRLTNSHNIKLFGDSQSSSQIGNVSKFSDYDLLTPTEKEARLALDDKYNGLEVIGRSFIKKTRAKNLVITLADKGFIAFKNNINNSFIKTQHFPALTINPLDVIGAGDALLSGLALCLCGGADLMEASAIAAGIASIAVNKIGNIPVNIKELRNWLKTIERIIE